MIENVDYKKFDLEHAKAYAPVMTNEGKPARIISFDRKNPKNPSGTVVALVEAHGSEEVYSYSVDGFRIHITGSLVMKPLFQLEGKNVFYKDKLEKLVPIGSSKTEWRELPASPNTHIGAILRWPIISLIFQGKNLTVDTRLWYCSDNGEWVIIRAGDISKREETHFDVIKRLGEATASGLYRFDKPVLLEGKEVKLTSMLWYNEDHSGNRWVQVSAGNRDKCMVQSHIDWLRTDPDTAPKYFRWNKPVMLEGKEVKADSEIYHWVSGTGLVKVKASDTIKGIRHFDRMCAMVNLQGYYCWNKPKEFAKVQKYQGLMSDGMGNQYLDKLLFNSPRECEDGHKSHSFIRAIPTIIIEEEVE